MLLGVTMLPRVFDADDSPLLRTATALGVVGMVVQIVGPGPGDPGGYARRVVRCGRSDERPL